MQTRRQTLKQSAVVAGLLAGTGLFPQYALAFNKAAFEAKNLNDALKALGASGAPAASTSVTLTAPDIAENGAVVPLAAGAPLAPRAFNASFRFLASNAALLKASAYCGNRPVPASRPATTALCLRVCRRVCIVCFS